MHNLDALVDDLMDISRPVAVAVQIISSTGASGDLMRSIDEAVSPQETERTGNMNDPKAAISRAELAVPATPKDHPGRAQSDPPSVNSCAATLVEVSETRGKTRVRLNAGKANGISPDIGFDVWPMSCSDFRASERLALLRVTGVEDVTLDAEVVEWHSALKHQLVPGCLARPRTASLQRLVQLVHSEQPGTPAYIHNSSDDEEEESQTRILIGIDFGTT